MYKLEQWLKLNTIELAGLEAALLLFKLEQGLKQGLEHKTCTRLHYTQLNLVTALHRTLLRPTSLFFSRRLSSSAILVWPNLSVVSVKSGSIKPVTI